MNAATLKKDQTVKDFYPEVFDLNEEQRRRIHTAYKLLSENPDNPKNADFIVSLFTDGVIPEKYATDIAERIFSDHLMSLETGINPVTLRLKIEKALKLQHEYEAEEQRELEKNLFLNEIKSLPQGLNPDEIIVKAKNIIDRFESKSTKKRIIEIPSFSAFTEHASTTNDNKSFSPRLFGELLFRYGTMSAVGARTGRGKTAAVVTLALEALQDGKTVLIATGEDSTFQMLERIILALYRKFWIGQPFEFFSAYEWPEWTLKNGYPDPRKCLYEIVRNTEHRSNHGDVLRQSYETVRELYQKGALKIIDTRGYSLDVILDTIRENPADITIIDYIQRLPAPADFLSATRQVQVQQTSNCLTALAAEIETVLIAMAQFKRVGVHGAKPAEYDIFSDESFREAGDIEQDAYNAVGIGQEEARRTSERYYKILKARESNPGDDVYRLNFEGAFSLLIPTGEKWRPSNGKNKSQKNNGGNSYAIDF